MQPLREARRDLPRRHHGPERQPVADPLGHRDDVGHDAVRLKAPVVLARPPEARLHLVGDAEPARGAHGLVGWLQEALDQRDGLFLSLMGERKKERREKREREEREEKSEPIVSSSSSPPLRPPKGKPQTLSLSPPLSHPPDALDRLVQEPGDPSRGAGVDRLLQLPRVLPSDRLVVAAAAALVGVVLFAFAEDAPVRVGARHVPDAEPGRDRVPPRRVRRRAVGRAAAAVVGVSQREQVVVPSKGSSEQNGQVVGLGARVREVGDVESGGQPGGELLGEEGDFRVEVDGGSVLEAVLFFFFFFFLPFFPPWFGFGHFFDEQKKKTTF